MFISQIDISIFEELQKKVFAEQEITRQSQERLQFEHAAREVFDEKMAMECQLAETAEFLLQKERASAIEAARLLEVQMQLTTMEEERFNAQQILQASLQSKQDKELELVQQISLRIAQETSAVSLLQRRLDEEADLTFVATNSSAQEQTALNEAIAVRQELEQRKEETRVQAEELTAQLIVKLTQNQEQNLDWCQRAKTMLKDAPVVVEVPAPVKANGGGRLRSSALLGLFACAGFVGAAGWAAFNAPNKIAVATVSGVSTPLLRGIKNSEVKLHMSYELGAIEETKSMPKAVTQIALNNLASNK